MSITLIIVIATVIVSFQAFNNTGLRESLIFRPTSIKDRKEYYRFITSGFIHADMTHLFVNMFVLYQFGQFAEQVFAGIFSPMMGRVIYALFYIAAIIISSIPVYFKQQDNYAYAALGASGATSALVFAYIIFRPWQWFVFPPLPGIILGFAYLAYSAYMDQRGRDNIGHSQHYWGAIFGVSFMLLVLKLKRPYLFDTLIDNLIHPKSSIFGHIFPFLFG